MQPLGRSRRQKIELRPSRPLRYETLSDPILVRRAKDGDRAALSALCERHAPRVERLASHLLSDPEDAGDAAQEALAKVCVRVKQFRGESAVHDLAAPSRRQHVPRRVRAAARAVLRAAVRGPARGCRRRPGACARRWPSSAPSSPTQLASISARQARVVVLKDAFDWSFAEIASRDGIPIGTAKCYAHRARSSLREPIARR